MVHLLLTRLLKPYPKYQIHHTSQIRYIDDYLDCATDASKAECGAGAAEYQKKLAQFSLGQLLESVGCESNNIVREGR